MSEQKPGVFIIESLKFDDEQKGYREGNILTDMLRLSGIESTYKYIRTTKELVAMIGQFLESSYKYLHISCHGNDEALGLTLDYLKFNELKKIIEPESLEKKRLFLSSCNVATQNLAQALLPSCVLSITGPSDEIGFNDAAIFWASFYHLMFSNNPNGMNSEQMKDVLNRVSYFYNVKINSFMLKKNKTEFNFYNFPET